MRFGAKLVTASILVLLVLLSGCVVNWPRITIGGPSCGNLECESGEDTATCPQDCGVCTDSDGVDYFTAGTTTDGAGATLSDSCTAGVLTEGLCYQNLAYSFRRPCDLGCNAAGTACEGTGTEVPAGQYCFSPNPANPADPNLNYYLEVGERTCHPTAGVEEVWECAIGAGGNAGFQLVENCLLRPPTPEGLLYGCTNGGCVPKTGLACPYACCSDAGCLAPYGTCSNPGTASAECVCPYACCSNSDCSPPYDVCSGAGTSSAQCITDPALVLQYNFDSDVTPVPDLSGKGNTGTVVNTGTVPNAVFGAAAGLNGGGAYTFSPSDTNTMEGGYIYANDSTTLRIPSSWTASAWVKLNALPASGKYFMLVAKGDAKKTTGRNHNYLLGIENGTWGTTAAGSITITALVENTFGDNYPARWTTNTIATGTWYNVAGVYDDVANVVKIYVNGMLRATYAANITADTGAPCVTIGGKGNCNVFGPADAALGTIDNVKIYKRALQTEEVLALYNRENCATPIPCFSNSDCGTSRTCQNPGVCGSANCVPCTVVCSSDAECASGETCLNAGTCDALCSVPNPSEVFFYDFTDQFSGITPIVPVDDVTTNNNNGTPSGGTVRISNGRLGYGAEFNGSGGYVNPPTVAALTDAFTQKTISMWIKANTTTVRQVLYDEGTSTTGIALWLNSNTINFSDKNSVAVKTVTSSFTDTVNWHHLVAVFNNGDMQLYVDSVLTGRGAAAASVAVHAVAPAIGRTDGSSADGSAVSGSYFYGQMDEVRVFNRALSLTEIKGLFYNCAVTCGNDAECADSDPLTNNVCNSPGTCAASCSSTTCTPACTEDADCLTGKNCYNGGTCNAECSEFDPSASVLFYSFNTNTTPLQDLSGKGNSGTVSNLAYNPTGGILGSGAYSFDGLNGHQITAANNSVFNMASGTWAIWANSNGNWLVDGDTGGTTVKGAAALMGRHDNATGAPNGITLGLNANGTAFATLKNASTAVSNISGIRILTDGKWHQIVLVFSQASGGINTLYVDGTLEASASNSAAWSFKDQGITIGDSNCTYWEEFSGLIDDARIYNTALTTAQVRELFKEGGGSPCSVACTGDADCTGGRTCVYDGTCNSFCRELVDSNLMLWYPFIRDDTPVFDMSEHGSNGTKSGGAAWLANGRLEGDGAYSFGGVDGYIQPNNSRLLPASAVTVAAWVNITGDGAATPNAIVSSQYPYLGAKLGYGLEYNETTDKFQATIAIGYSANFNDYTVSSNTAPAFGTWYHVAFTYDSTLADANRLKIYVNGVSDGNVPTNKYTILYSAGSFMVGEYVDEVTLDPQHVIYALNGKVDDVRVYDRALSADEIAVLASGTGCPTPIACYADVGCGALSKCQSPGVCGSAQCVSCTSACGTDADCGAGRVCINKNMCGAHCENTDPSNVLLYNFETAATPIPDLSGNGNTGTVVGATYMPQSRFGYGAYYFDGAGGYISVPHNSSLAPPAPFTVAAWVKPDDIYTAPTWGDSIIDFAGNNTGYRLTWFSNNPFLYNSTGFGLVDGNGTQERICNARDVQNGNWYYVVAVHDTPSQSRIYVNGTSVGYHDCSSVSGMWTDSSYVPNADPARALTIGGWCSNPASCALSRQFRGLIGEVRIYNRTLSSGEILALYKQGACETGIECFLNADCRALETCQNPGVCGSAACVPYTPLCTSNADCGAGKTCLGANTSSACCSACTTNADCDDGVPATTDTCTYPNSCSASCTNTSCATPPACVSDSDCDDSNPNTMNICNGAGKCSASCYFPTALDITPDGSSGIFQFEPTIVSNGSGYGVFWADKRTHYLRYARLSSAGSKIVAHAIADNVAVKNMSVPLGAVWNGERQEYAIVATVNGAFSFIRIGMDGALKAPVTQISQLLNCSPNCIYSEMPEIVLRPGNQADPNDDRYGIVWGEETSMFSGTVYFTEVDATGNPIPLMNYKYVCFTNGPGLYDNPSVLWTGSAYKVFCVDSVYGSAAAIALKATTIMPDGTTSSEIISSPDGWIKFMGAAASSSGGGYAVGWRSYDPLSESLMSIFTKFTKTDSSDIVSVSNEGGNVKSVAFGDSEYGIVWIDTRNESLKIDYDPLSLACPIWALCFDVYFARFSTSGARLSNDMRINDNIAMYNKFGSVAYDASSGRYAVAWQNGKYTGIQYLYFKLVPDCTVACDSNADCSPGVCTNPATCSAACQ